MSSQEVIRRKQFCQMVAEIKGSDQFLVVGIDVAKNRHHAFMGNTRGISLLRKLVFENNLDGFSKLRKTAEHLMARHDLSKIVYGLEPTGNYHKPLARHLIGLSCDVVLVTGLAVKSNRQTIDGRWDKNDTKDSANVADLVSRGRCLFYDCPSEQILQLRGLLSLRRDLKQEEHGVRMRIRNSVLAQYFPELDRFYSACESETLAIVKWCPNPAEISGLDFDKFFQMVTRSRRGTAQTLRLRKVHQAAKDTIGCPMGAAAEFEAKLLVEKLEQVRRQLHDTEDAMEDIALNFPEYSYLLTIPGFGRYISTTVLATIADPLRFESRKHVLKMSGYDLSASRSGNNSEKAVPVISKKGNGQLRYALYQAANVASTRTFPFRDYFNHLLKGRERERGIQTKMRVKLAAKLLVIAWTLMKRKEVFDPKHLNIE